MDQDPDHIYKLSHDDRYIAHKVISYDGRIVYIQYSELALVFHEISHIRQSLKSIKGLVFESMSNALLSATGNKVGIVSNEIEAYRIQFSFDKRSMPIIVSGIDQIDVKYLQRILTPNHEYAYPDSHIEGMTEHNFLLDEKFKYYKQD